MALSNNISLLPDQSEVYMPVKKIRSVGIEAEMRLKKSTIHHERCRAVAELLWSIEPELTIADMARRIEIIKFGCEGDEYDVRTICRWLANLKDDRRPGRPRKRMVADKE